MTVGSGIFFAWVFTVIVFASLWVWTLITISGSLPGWVGSKVMLNSISIVQNQAAVVQNVQMMKQQERIHGLERKLSKATVRRAIDEFQKEYKKYLKAMGGP